VCRLKLIGSEQCLFLPLRAMPHTIQSSASFYSEQCLILLRAVPHTTWSSASYQCHQHHSEQCLIPLRLMQVHQGVGHYDTHTHMQLQGCRSCMHPTTAPPLPSSGVPQPSRLEPLIEEFSRKWGLRAWSQVGMKCPHVGRRCVQENN
jgi:hypothetical protein